MFSLQLSSHLSLQCNVGNELQLYLDCWLHDNIEQIIF